MAKTTVSQSNNINTLIKNNYQSLGLGFIIFVLLIIGIIHFIQNYQHQQSKADATNKVVLKEDISLVPTIDKPTITQPAMVAQKKEDKKLALPTNEKTYTVKPGDSLWSISQTTYGSGYNAYDIAQANNLVDPNAINAGLVIKLPNVQAKAPTIATPSQGQTSSIATGKVTLKADTYTVVRGDSLWDIALRAYGDGYMWHRLAEANHLDNPDRIYRGNVLTIPRS